MQLARVARLAINAEGFVFDPQTGESFTVNETGRLILETLPKARTPEAVVDVLLARFDVTRAEAEADVRDFLDLLHALKLL